jgi:PAS domain S-box
MNSLISAIKQIKAGNLGHEAEIISNDEVGELAREFNNMTSRLLQFEQSTLGKLVEEKNKSITIVKSISDPLIVLDTNYRIILINDASEHFFGIKEESALERHFLEVIRNGELFDFVTTAKDEKDAIIQKIISINTGAEEHFFNVSVTVIKNDKSSLAGFVVLLQNVTQLKHLEKIRNDFIATISHEFKTPLTSIIMGTDLVLGEVIGKLNSEQKEVATAIKEDGERLSILVNDLLELTKIESGKAVYKMDECSMVSIIESSIKQFFQFAEQKGVILLTNADKSLPKVKADYEKITWVLNNLISNALKYTKEGDHILVLAEEKNDKVYVTVKDTGVGIPAEYLNIIFDKFVQVKGGDFEMRGTGLGLAVVKEIVEAHEGKIWCESELDSGSSFTFTLNIVY